MRRMTNAIEVTVSLTPTVANACRVPDGFIPKNARLFRVINLNPCPVWLVGTSRKMDGSLPTAPVLQTGTLGWCFLPWERDENPTQNPVYMSARADPDSPQFPTAGLTFRPLLLWWGE